jgi:precorrin-2/cobalt-factor-2 C20-methyltransferase
VNNLSGKLYIIGVGPGDPGLLTLRAVEVLRSARRVFIPVSGQGRDSLAFEIIQDHISAEASITELVFPMTLDRQAMDAAYRKNYLLVSSVLRTGDDAVLVTIGDPALYSTAWQIYKLVQEHAQEIASEIVPGITSFSSAASRAGIQLAKSSDCLSVVSSYNDPARLEQIIDCADTVVFLKTYRSRDMLISLLKKKGLLSRCVYIQRCGLPGEEIVRDLSALSGDAEYFSLIILRKEGLQ